MLGLSPELLAAGFYLSHQIIDKPLILRNFSPTDVLNQVEFVRPEEISSRVYSHAQLAAMASTDSNRCLGFAWPIGSGELRRG